jgi:hypothetical protein
MTILMVVIFPHPNSEVYVPTMEASIPIAFTNPLESHTIYLR